MCTPLEAARLRKTPVGLCPLWGFLSATFQPTRNASHFLNKVGWNVTYNRNVMCNIPQLVDKIMKIDKIYILQHKGNWVWIKY
jgi:hypothetical protein